MADEMTPGEIRRTLDRVEREQRDAQRAVDDRITKLAADMVPTSLWASEHRSLKDDVDDVKTDVTEAKADMQAALLRVENATAEKFKAQGREIAGLRTELGKIREERTTKSVTTWQIIIALIAALAAVALVVEGLLQSGGH